MTYAYPRGVRGPVVQDVTLVAAWFVAWFLVDVPAVRVAMMISIPIVLAWGALTLHFPSRVDLDDDAISFVHYGRAHRFAWSDVTRVRVRRFLMKDRVLVRIEPTSAWRGRYWLVDSIADFDALVAALEARAKLTR